jgi:hypothetical protein
MSIAGTVINGRTNKVRLNRRRTLRLQIEGKRQARRKNGKGRAR